MTFLHGNGERFLTVFLPEIPSSVTKVQNSTNAGSCPPIAMVFYTFLRIFHPIRGIYPLSPAKKPVITANLNVCIFPSCARADVLRLSAPSHLFAGFHRPVDKCHILSVTLVPMSPTGKRVPFITFVRHTLGHVRHVVILHLQCHLSYQSVVGGSVRHIVPCHQVAHKHPCGRTF